MLDKFNADTEKFKELEGLFLKKHGINYNENDVKKEIRINTNDSKNLKP